MTTASGICTVRRSRTLKRALLSALMIFTLASSAWGQPTAGEPVETPVSALAIDPATPSTIYAGTWGGGAFKSTNGGASWSPTGLAGLSVRKLAIDPLTPTTLYAEASRGVFKSTDGGASWSSVAGPSDYDPLVSFFAIDPQTPTTIYAQAMITYSCDYPEQDTCTDEVLVKSTDGGATWGFSGPSWVVDLAIDPLTPTTLYAVTFYGDLLKSTDGGVTWTWPSAALTGIEALAIDPKTPTTIYAGTRETVYCWGCWDTRHLFKSTDGGARWSLTGWQGAGTGFPLLAVDPHAPNTLYLGTSYGMIKSTDGGMAWSLSLSLGVHALAFNPANPGTLYAGTATGVYRSTDGGSNWSLTGSIPWSRLSALTLDPTSVTGGSASTGTVTLSGAAPPGGAAVTLFSSNPVGTVPASVTIPAGATSANFTVSTNAVTASTVVTISGTYSGITRSAALTINPVSPPDTAMPDTSIVAVADGDGASLPNDGATLSSVGIITFKGTDNVAVAGFECRLGGANFATCTSPVTYSGLAVGRHDFEVRAVDTANNRDGTPAAYTWTVDSPPETTITSAVDRQGNRIPNGGFTRSSQITFSFTGTDNVSVTGFECSLDGAAFTPCTSPITYAGGGRGTHTFRVRTIDNNGFRDPTPAAFTWTR